MALKRIAATIAISLFGVLAAYGQAGEPVVPLVNNAPVSASNPLPVTGGTGSGDACQTQSKLSVPISQTSNTRVLLGSVGLINHVCSYFVLGADAEDISLVEGTGSICGTATAAIIGGATAANGPNFAASGGVALGNGAAQIAFGHNQGYDVCLLQSGSGVVAGVITFVQQ